MHTIAIINNQLVVDETKLRIFSPFFYVPNPDKSEALGLAYLYFGVEDTNPTLITNQKRVYALQEDGSAVAISQPVRTGAGGLPEVNGSVVNLAIDGAYSFTVKDSNLTQVYNFQSIINPSFSSSGIVTVKEDVITTITAQTVITFPTVDVSQAVIDVSGTNLVDPTVIDSRSLFRDVDYAVTDGGAGIITLIVPAFPAGTLIRARQNATTDQSNILANTLTVFTQPDMATAITTNFAIGDTVKILSDSSSDDGLTNDYDVVAAGTGSADGINFIDMTNTFQFRLISTRNKLQAYTEAIGVSTVLAGVLTIDLNNGPVQTVTLAENISSIIFGNVSTIGSTTVQIKIKQDATGIRTVNFTGFITAGGVTPAVSVGANQEDIFVFQTLDGVTWYLFPAGENMVVI